MPIYRVQVSSTSWITYEIEAKNPTDAARKGWQCETDEGQEVDSDGHIDDVSVYAGDDRWHNTLLDYDQEAATNGDDANEESEDE